MIFHLTPLTSVYLCTRVCAYASKLPSDVASLTQVRSSTDEGVTSICFALRWIWCGACSAGLLLHMRLEVAHSVAAGLTIRSAQDLGKRDAIFHIHRVLLPRHSPVLTHLGGDHISLPRLQHHEVATTVLTCVAGACSPLYILCDFCNLLGLLQQHILVACCNCFGGGADRVHGYYFLHTNILLNSAHFDTAQSVNTKPAPVFGAVVENWSCGLEDFLEHLRLSLIIGTALQQAPFWPSLGHLDFCLPACQLEGGSPRCGEQLSRIARCKVLAAEMLLSLLMQNLLIRHKLAQLIHVLWTVVWRYEAAALSAPVRKVAIEDGLKESMIFVLEAITFLQAAPEFLTHAGARFQVLELVAT
mmetsp:Transcript_24228/g.42798  ORF Transcript_24228/g.42798 Transcript_24228/m.42798 type:complete len:359 (+) Transcript_24228:1-1077(+)